MSPRSGRPVGRAIPGPWASLKVTDLCAAPQPLAISGDLGRLRRIGAAG
ncbi:MAG: hypothetical protein ACJA1L_001130, partial [Paracoccaceae bacterium]